MGVLLCPGLSWTLGLKQSSCLSLPSSRRWHNLPYFLLGTQITLFTQKADTLIVQVIQRCSFFATLCFHCSNLPLGSIYALMFLALASQQRSFPHFCAPFPFLLWYSQSRLDHKLSSTLFSHRCLSHWSKTWAKVGMLSDILCVCWFHLFMSVCDLGDSQLPVWK